MNLLNFLPHFFALLDSSSIWLGGSKGQVPCGLQWEHEHCASAGDGEIQSPHRCHSIITDQSPKSHQRSCGNERWTRGRCWISAGWKSTRLLGQAVVSQPKATRKLHSRFTPSTEVSTDLDGHPETCRVLALGILLHSGFLDGSHAELCSQVYHTYR